MSEKRRVVAVKNDERGREIDDDYAPTGRVLVGKSVDRVLIDEEADPFAQSPEVFKTFEGVTPAFKKKATRAFTKVHQGSGGAASKKVEDNALNGYNPFGVVTPS